MWSFRRLFTASTSRFLSAAAPAAIVIAPSSSEHNENNCESYKHFRRAYQLLKSEQKAKNEADEVIVGARKIISDMEDVIRKAESVKATFSQDVAEQCAKELRSLLEWQNFRGSVKLALEIAEQWKKEPRMWDAVKATQQWKTFEQKRPQLAGKFKVLVEW